MMTHARVGQLPLEGCARAETLDTPLFAKPNRFQTVPRPLYEASPAPGVAAAPASGGNTSPSTYPATPLNRACREVDPALRRGDDLLARVLRLFVVIFISSRW